MLKLYPNKDDALRLGVLIRSNMSNIEGGRVEHDILGCYMSNGKSYTPLYDINTTWFYISYNKGIYLRVNVDGPDYTKNIEILGDIGELLSKSKDKEQDIGRPIAFYNIKENDRKSPYLDWVFTNIKEYEEALRNKTLYKDKRIEDLVMFEDKLSIKEQVERYKRLVLLIDGKKVKK